MTLTELEKINAERRRKGLSPLTKQHAESVVASHNDNSGFDFTSFLIGYETGIGFSPEGMIGAAMHHESEPTPSYAPDSTPSYDSGVSSSSYDSSPTPDISSSSDSGGSW